MSPQVEQEEFSKNSWKFALNLSNQLKINKPNGNIIFSPFSIQTALAMVRVGAQGQTATEIDQVLQLPFTDISKLGDSFQQVLTNYQNSDILKIANKIYIKNGYTLKPQFNEILAKKFYSTAEGIDFERNVEAASNINQWVKSKTNDLIKELISPEALNSMTRIVLLNAIYFKGQWQHQFRKLDTELDKFYINENDSVKVNMMKLKETIRYADLTDLDATAIELPYKNTDLSMLIILPNSRTGLQNLEEKLSQTKLSDITSQLSAKKVIVRLPRFKTKFTIELKKSLRNLGLLRLFTAEAELGNMLETEEALQVTKVIHQAHIEVNEEGTEAAAATVVTVRKKRSLVFTVDPIEFNADHPFIYYINHIVESVNDDDATSSYHPIPLFMGIMNEGDITECVQQHDEL